MHLIYRSINILSICANKYIILYIIYNINTPLPSGHIVTFKFTLRQVEKYKIYKYGGPTKNTYVGGLPRTVDPSSFRDFLSLPDHTFFLLSPSFYINFIFLRNYIIIIIFLLLFYK